MIFESPDDIHNIDGNNYIFSFHLPIIWRQGEVGARDERGRGRTILVGRRRSEVM